MQKCVWPSFCVTEECNGGYKDKRCDQREHKDFGQGSKLYASPEGGDYKRQVYGTGPGT